jgi:hypothetical protein
LHDSPELIDRSDPDPDARGMPRAFLFAAMDIKSRG